jgi:hypothetical protein
MRSSREGQFGGGGGGRDKSRKVRSRGAGCDLQLQRLRPVAGSLASLSSGPKEELACPDGGCGLQAVGRRHCTNSVVVRLLLKPSSSPSPSRAGSGSGSGSSPGSLPSGLDWESGLSL